jgi:predicted membrane protein
MSTGQLIFGLLFIAIGISSFTNIDIFHYLVPACFILLGVRILAGKRWERRGVRGESKLNQDEINEVSIFSGSRKYIDSAQFRGGKAAAIFSGMELDVTKVKAKGKIIELELVAVFGELKVIVPADWHVTTEGAGIIGAFDNHTESKTTAHCELHLKGAAIFGAVEIVN